MSLFLYPRNQFLSLFQDPGFTEFLKHFAALSKDERETVLPTKKKAVIEEEEELMESRS